MELSPRLRSAAELVPPGARFADIGTDHAYLPVWLILNGVIDHAIAADLRQGPLDRARETAEKYCVSDRMDFRLCDGLTGLRTDEADTIAIAGMGGETIANILADAPWTKGEGITLILQPMSSQPDLRQWLFENGYVIEKECIACEDKTLYTIMLVKAGQMEKLTPAELLAGRQSSDPLRGEYLDRMIAKVGRALEGQRAAARRDEAAIGRSAQILDGLTAMKKEWDAWQR
ncbi:MAG: tRNA (adenine(22)-N(1))-methyltransferase [Oscillospiraceae bacterium]